MAKLRMLSWFPLVAACGSGVSVEGEIGGLSFHLVTVYAFIDATAREVDAAEGKVRFTDREHDTLHVIMSGASFNPAKDARFRSAEQILEIVLDEERNGRVEIEVTESEGLGNGAVLTAPGSGGPPALNVSRRFGWVRVDGDAEYPPEAPLLGSRETYTLTLNEIEREPGQHVRGTLVLSIERDDGDPPGVVTGSITIDFDAELIGERIAECNENQQSCELVRP